MKGILGYNSQNDRYGLLVMDLWVTFTNLYIFIVAEIEGFHCGQTLEVWNSEAEKWIPTRMEMHYPNEWYLIGTALEGLTVRIDD